MSRFRRWLLKTARTVHVYVTLFGLTLILFFAVTGFMLNHIEWFLPDEPRTVREARPLPLDRLPGGRLPEAGEVTGDQKLAVVEALRKEFGIAGELWSFDNGDEAQIVVGFRRAGGETEARVRRDGAAEVERRSQGWAVVLTDLHRGNRGNVSGEPRLTGAAWSWVIDVTCVLLLVISATGLFLWWSLKARGKWGAVLLLLGGGAASAVYYWWVP
ncbi:MAG: hypothetical protein C0501_17780 [Isosphaera sp.]|nr:hypothetical protein [Isosphaera sp.]